MIKINSNKNFKKPYIFINYNYIFILSFKSLYESLLIYLSIFNIRIKAKIIIFIL